MTAPLNVPAPYSIIYQSPGPTNFLRLTIIYGPKVTTSVQNGTEAPLAVGVNNILINSEVPASLQVIVKRGGEDTIMATLPRASQGTQIRQVLVVPNEDAGATIRFQQVTPDANVKGTRCGVTITTVSA